MRHSLLRCYLGTGVLGTALILGCQQNQKRTTCPPRPPVQPAAPVAESNIHYSKQPLGQLPPPSEESEESMPPVKAIPETHMAPPPPVQAAVPDSLQVPTGSGPLPIQRRTFTDITADARFAHAADYSWMIGNLEYISYPDNAWRVRYASLDETDPYGGSVTLTETGPMDKYKKDGQIVRIEGELLKTTGRRGNALYRVRSIQPVE